jgi:hypothetical protein
VVGERLELGVAIWAATGLAHPAAPYMEEERTMAWVAPVTLAVSGLAGGFVIVAVVIRVRQRVRMMRAKADEPVDGSDMPS